MIRVLTTTLDDEDAIAFEPFDDEKKLRSEEEEGRVVGVDIIL